MQVLKKYLKMKEGIDEYIVLRLDNLSFWKHSKNLTQIKQIEENKFEILSSGFDRIPTTVKKLI